MAERPEQAWFAPSPGIAAAVILAMRQRKQTRAASETPGEAVRLGLGADHATLSRRQGCHMAATALGGWAMPPSLRSR